MLAKYYRGALAIAAALIFFLNVDGYLFSSGILVDISPVYWVIAYLVFAIPLTLNRGLLAAVLRSRLSWWCFSYIIISGTWVFFQSSNSEIVWQSFGIRVSSVLFLLCLLLVLSKETAQVWARYALLVAVLLGVAINVYELFHPATFSPIVGRSAGLYINPNRSGNALVLGMIFCAGILNRRLRLLLLILVFIGVALTFSRAAIAGYLIAVLALFLTGTISIRKSLLVGLAALSALFIPLLVFWDSLLLQLQALHILNQNVLARIDWFTKPKGAADHSSIERYDVAKAAWKMFTERPIFGNGIASTKDWSYAVSSHNQYLNFMADHGIIGIFILPLLVLAVTWRATGGARQTGVTFAAFTLFMGFFSHNVLDERYFLVTFGLMAAMVVHASTRGQTPFSRNVEEV